MGLFIAEIHYSYTQGNRVYKEKTITRLIKAPNLKMANDMAKKYWEKFKKDSVYPFPDMIFLQEIDVTEPIE